jgi:hypothetical protein
VIQQPVELAVTAALYLERLVRTTYGELETEAPARAPDAPPDGDVEAVPIAVPRTVSRLLRRPGPGLTGDDDES